MSQCTWNVQFDEKIVSCGCTVKMENVKKASKNRWSVVRKVSLKKIKTFPSNGKQPWHNTNQYSPTRSCVSIDSKMSFIYWVLIALHSTHENRVHSKYPIDGFNTMKSFAVCVSDGVGRSNGNSRLIQWMSLNKSDEQTFSIVCCSYGFSTSLSIIDVFPLHPHSVETESIILSTIIKNSGKIKSKPFSISNSSFTISFDSISGARGEVFQMDFCGHHHRECELFVLDFFFWFSFSWRLTKHLIVAK